MPVRNPLAAWAPCWCGQAWIGEWVPMGRLLLCGAPRPVWLRLGGRCARHSGVPWSQASLPVMLRRPHLHSGLPSRRSLLRRCCSGVIKPGRWVSSTQPGELHLLPAPLPLPPTPTRALAEVGHPRPPCFAAWLLGFWRMTASSVL